MDEDPLSAAITFRCRVDEEEEEEAETSGLWDLPTPFLANREGAALAVGAHLTTDLDLLVVGFGTTADLLLQHACKSAEARVVGSLHCALRLPPSDADSGPTLKDTSVTLFSLAGGKVLLVGVATPPVPERAGAWASALLAGTAPKRVVALCALPSSACHAAALGSSAGTSDPLFLVESGGCTNGSLFGTPPPAMRPLPAGALVSGAPASLFSRMAARGGAARLIVEVQPPGGGTSRAALTALGAAVEAHAAAAGLPSLGFPAAAEAAGKEALGRNRERSLLYI